MTKGWQYRIASVGGTLVLVTLAVSIANHPLVQSVAGLVPLLGRLPATTATGGVFELVTLTTAAIFLGAFVPLFKPRPRRILDVVGVAQKRVFIAVIALAAIGYFDYTYRLPRLTLVLAGGVLAIALPAWFVAIRRRPSGDAERVVLVGDDADELEAVLEAACDSRVVGYVGPPAVQRTFEPALVFDGGVGLSEVPCLGGLSRLDEVLVEHDVDGAVLAFSHPDRAEFFGTLDACYKHGVTAKIHRTHADSVLTQEFGSDELVRVDLEPWDPQDHMLKRAFDVAFSLVGLVLVAPVMLVVAVTVKLEDGGPVLYSQERTAELGDTFRVYKFRSMVTNAEELGAQLSEEDAGGVDPRVTRVGRVIRPTHLDEIPQLWSIFVGNMSVVGPRPERPELDGEMEIDAGEWRSRWFVKPGLTGLAQISGATGFNPEEKLHYDVEYIRKQSFWFDLKIVIRQTWIVLIDLL
jgi:lipopolysaccharide/colanic/teichoic acid biosynthesis glycosyltransferase